MTTQQKEAIYRLADQGGNARSIGEKLNISKSSVDRVLQERKSLGDQPDEKEESEQPAAKPAKPATSRTKTPEEIELDKLEMTQAHERAMKGMEIKEQEVALEQQKYTYLTNKLAHDKQQGQQLAGAKEQQTEQVNQLQELLTDKFNKLIKEVLKNCQDDTWSEDEVDDFIDRAKNLLKKIDKFCADQALNEETLAIYHHGKSLIKLIEQTKADYTHTFGSDVDFDYSKKQIKELKSWIISDFQQTIEAEEDEEEDEEEPEEENEQESKLLASYNELVDEFLESCDNTVWTNEEYEDYENRLKAFKSELDEYTEEIEEKFDDDEQAIAVNLDVLIKFVADMEAVEDDDDDDNRTVTANTKQKKILKALKLDDFWQEV